MIDKNDWRLTWQDEYLMNARLVYRPYPAEKDHSHCTFCFEKFSWREGDLQEGYCTPDGVYWICPECYADFKEMFGFVCQEDEKQ